jgi:polygalacturonase
MRYNIKDFGIKLGGKDPDCTAIQKVIAEVTKKGGGEIFFPKGDYFSGPIVAGSNIILHLAEGAVLRFSDDFSFYPPAFTRWEGVECYGFAPLLVFRDAEGSGLIGEGTLDGSGEKWWRELQRKRKRGVTAPESKEELALARLNRGFENQGSGGGGREMQFLRPSLFQIINGKNIKVDGITFTNSPFWTFHLLYSENVTVKHSIFRNPADAPNTDGLNIDSSRKITVEDCLFDVGDDCLCLKSGLDDDGRRVGKPTEDITVTGCTMKKGHGGIVIGSETSGNIRRATITHCSMLGTDRGVRIKTRRGRGGVVEDISFDNITMDDVLCPVAINLFYRCGAFTPDEERFSEEKMPVTEKTPRVRSLSFNRCTATKVRAACGFFYGLPEMPIEKLSFIDSSFSTHPDKTVSGGEPDMVWGIKPMQREGLWGKFSKDFTFRNVIVKGAQKAVSTFTESENIDTSGILRIE